MNCEEWNVIHGARDVEIDKEGKHIASVTIGGCLAIHDFEALYREAQEMKPGTEHVASIEKLKLHMHMNPNAIKWNPSNRHQV